MSRMECGCKIPRRYQLKWLFQGLYKTLTVKDVETDSDAIFEWNKKKGNCNGLH